MRYLILIVALFLSSCSNSQVLVNGQSDQPNNIPTNNNPVTTNPTVTNTNAKTNTANTTQINTNKKSLTVTPVPADWQKNNHIHGIAVHPHDPNIVYLATHHGIVLRDESNKWLQVGKDRSDFMSFVADINDHNKLYGSGHPPAGGNMGFVVSEDGGETWQQKSLPGVDFHGLAIAPSDSNIFYGWIASSQDGKQGLFTSTDAGKTWQSKQANGLQEHPFSLVVDPIDANIVFATTGVGLYQSKDGGDNWQLIPNSNGLIISLSLVKEGEKVVMYGYQFAQENSGIVKSQDYGKNWQGLSSEIAGPILYLANAPSQPEIFYGVNDQNVVFKSVDRAKTWQMLN